MDPAKYSSISRGQLDNLRDEYDVATPYSSFRFAVPKNLRSTLPIPGGYENARWLYSNVPIPGEEMVYVFFAQLEGHRSKFDHTDYFLLTHEFPSRAVFWILGRRICSTRSHRDLRILANPRAETKMAYLDDRDFKNPTRKRRTSDSLSRT